MDIKTFGKMNFLIFLGENNVFFSTHQLGVFIQPINSLNFKLPCPIDQGYINL